MTHKKYDEYVIGEQFISYGRTATETDLVNYTCLAGLKPPVFIDEAWCEDNSIFGTRVFPGLLTASFAAGMLEDILGPHTLAALGLNDFTFTEPVKIGDTLRVRATVEDKEDTRNGTRGILTVLVEVLNQHEKTPARFRGRFLFRKD